MFKTSNTTIANTKTTTNIENNLHINTKAKANDQTYKMSKHSTANMTNTNTIANTNNKTNINTHND